MELNRLEKVLVTGRRGQLAGAIVDTFSRSAEVIAYTRDELDITDLGAVMSCVQSARPGAIINCAAYNRVDDAEEHAMDALAVNAFAVRTLARAAQAVGATLVHYSTDFVFDGTAKRPYREEDPPNPQSVYAQSKLMGEWFALEAPGALVLRVESLFGGKDARSSIDRIARALLSGEEARVFVDRTVSPSFVDDVAAATKALLERRAAPGLYHCVGTGHATWYDVAREIARATGKGEHARLLPVSVADVTLRAARPQFAALSNDKLNTVFEMPTWQNALRRYLA
jgi:dTDP-4-dehydrorhamnose reductase